MAAFCINTHSQEFKDTAKRLGVSQFELEQIAYKYGNQEGTFGQFPSDEYIKEQLDGVPNYNATEAQAELWKMRYSTPREFDTLEELSAAKKDALQYFNDSSVHSFVNADGKYELRVSRQEALENPEEELRKVEDEAKALTERIITLEKSLRGKYIYEGTIKTSDGEIKVTISDTDKDSNQDKIWLSSGKSIFGAVSMSIETNLKDGIVGGSILFPSISAADRENNYNRINNPIRNQHASILKQVLNQFINFGKLHPKSKWEALASSESLQIETKIQNLSSLLGVDVSPYFSLEQREVEETQEIQERVVIDARRLRDALSFVAEDTSFSSIEDAIQYNEAYNEASKIGFGKDNRRNRKQLEDELRSANKERDALWSKIRSLKDEVRRMKSSPWAFDAEEDLPFQKSPDTGNVTGLPDQMTADEAFQILSKQYAPDSSEGKLSKLVFDVLQQTGITFKASDRLPFDVRGRFSASDNTIFFNKNGISSNTLLHESIHAVSIYYMKAVNKSGFSKEVQIACKEIEECYELLKQDMLDRKVPIDSIYGMTSATELVAEITRPEVISLIRDYDSRHKGKNIFQRLVDAIAEFFGINKSYGSLEKTLKDALVTLIENPSAQLMKRYALENRTAKENWNTLRENAVEWSRTDKYRGIIESAAERAPESGKVEIVISKQDVLDEAAFRVPDNASGGILTESPIGTLFVSVQRRGPFSTQEEAPIFFTIDGPLRVDGDNVTLPIQLISSEWMSTNQFSIQTAKNGMPYITDVMPLFGSATQQSQQTLGQQVTTTSETATQEEPMWAPPKVERAFREGQETIVTKMDNLLKSGTLTVTEVMDEANKAMDWISDQLTQYLEDPELVWSKYKSSEDKNDVVARVSKMSRKELVDYIGVPNIINIYAAEVLSPTEDTVNADGSVTKGNKELFKALGRQGRANYRLIKDNIDGLIQYGYTRFLAREGFGFQLSDVEGEGFTTTEEVSPEDRISVDNFNATDNIDGDEETRNQQEHWMIENATRDIMDNASVKVKQAIADCYLLEDNGKTKEDGTPDYDIAKDKLNRNERVAPIQAVRSIVKWIQGATKLSQMIERLEAQVSAHPWVSQLVTRLKDTTGEESDFQSQFFNTFEKHFQAYSIVKMNPDGSFYTMTVNVNPALADALENMAVTRKVGGWSLVNENGLINLSTLGELKTYGDTLENLGPLDEDTREGAIDMVGNILFTLGLPQTPEVVDRLLTESFKNDIVLGVKNIVEKLTEVSKNNVKDYNPFEYGGKYGIRGFVTTIIKPFTNLLEETMVSSVFDSGKMYQSYLTPSWTTKLFQKMHLPDREFKEFILDEFGSSEWFIEPNTNLLADLNEKSLEGLTEQERDAAILQAKIDYISSPKHSNIWRTPWLAALIRMTPEQREEAFQHKVQLNFNKQNYMRGMDDLTYVMSVFTEYFSVSAKGAGGNMFAYYRFPMLSNKPSNEFVKFIRYGDIGAPDFHGDGANAILNGYVSIFRQELSRIQTVEMRNLKEGDEGYIANFDANGGKGSGLRFNFLDYLNEYLTGDKKTTALGQLLNRKLHATQSTALPDGTSKFYASPSTTEYAGNTLFALTAEENSQLEELVKEEIAKHLDGLANKLIERYKANGLFEALKNIEGVGKNDFDVEGAIREFAWNDNYAQANLLQILVTDKAFYKNEEDLQKRLAQVHSPGTRGNWEALDFGERNEKGELIRAPQKVSDGKLRVLKLKDYNEVKESIIENLKAVFSKKIEEAPESEKQAYKDLMDNIVAAYEKINVVDGQAFVSPTAYRKKSIAFGEWTKDDERVYKELMDGRFNMADIKRVFNPRKPFTYGKTTKQVSASLGTPISSLRYGVQYKDSEYLLIMADAILRGQETKRPNLLGAIFDVMENSYKTDSTEGIDFVVFDSGVKTGLSGAISISEFIDVEDGQRLATEKIQSLIYQDGKLGGVYNENYIDVLDAEDYTTQQSVPEHFMHGSLQWGSQIRALMPSDLETSYDGQPVVYDCEYEVEEKGEDGKIHTVIKKNPTAEQLRKAWEENTKKMVDLSVEELRKELGLVKGMSVADSNVLISKILQREILSNPRYGVDLLLACSVDAEGNFRIPLGDPIQSKRVEQLLNSIIKNRINKQKVAGGTLVEVTNFGTSKRLNIRFKDKNDATGKKLLDTRAEYLAKGHTQKEFEDYVKENQGGIAYYECYAPAWTRDLFLKFADEKGNIDIEAIEMLEPDLLKMYGYRIPTEDKYSTAPYKIVGFLPQEAGDGFMQPWETTVIDGSDFDVDKRNLMRMDLDIETKVLSKREFFEQEGYTEETEENLKEYIKYRSGLIGAKAIYNKLGDAGNIGITKEEAQQIEWYTESKKTRDLDSAMHKKVIAEDEAIDDVDRNDSLVKVYTTFNGEEVEYQPLQDTIDELESREELTSADENRIEKYKNVLKKIENKYSEKEREIERKSKEYKEKDILRAKRDKKIAIVNQILREDVFRPSESIPANQRKLFLAIKKAYIESLFSIKKPEAGTRGYYNNLMFNMQWAIATHASTADKMLNPGNFDPQKRAGYMVEANRLGYDWDELQKMSIGELKDLVFTSKNLMDFDVQTQFYKQNSVAGQVLGIFAVAKSAHAMFESRNYGILVERPFYIDGMEFSGAMHYDQKYDRKGNLIGKTLGSLVGASADAVKDPVLNFMNINKETINVLNTALRLGLDFETAALLLSSKAVSDVIETYRKNSLTRKTSFEKEIKAVLRELEKNEYIGKDSALQRQNLTNEEMVWSIRGLEAEKPTEEEIKNANIIKYKVLNAILGLSYASRTAQPLSDLSRLNSITSAPGPLYINTIVSDRKFGPAMSMDGIVKFSTGENGVENHVPATRSMVFEELESLGAFYQSYDIAKQLFKRLKFTTATDKFEKLLGIIPADMQFSMYTNEALLKSLADFFQSFLLVQSGVIKSSALERYTTEFVTDYMAGKYTKDEKVANNPLIKAIQPKLISKKGQPDRYALNIDTTGMEQSEKDALSAGWTQLEKDDPTLSHMLFAYNFFRGGIGFSPKTFMGLVPIQVKEGIEGYNETFERLPEIGDYYSIFDQWVRNNWTNTELVTKITTKPYDGKSNTVTFKGYREMSLIYGSPYVRISTKDGDFLFRMTSSSKTEATYTRVEPLGGNREYLEIYPTDTPVTAMDNLQRGLALLETQESEIVERREDNPDVEQTPEEQTRELTDFYQVAFAEETSVDESREVTDSQFEEINKGLDIRTNKDKFDDIMDNFC